MTGAYTTMRNLYEEWNNLQSRMCLCSTCAFVFQLVEHVENAVRSSLLNMLECVSVPTC